MKDFRFLALVLGATVLFNGCVDPNNPADDDDTPDGTSSVALMVEDQNGNPVERGSVDIDWASSTVLKDAWLPGYGRIGTMTFAADAQGNVTCDDAPVDFINDRYEADLGVLDVEIDSSLKRCRWWFDGDAPDEEWYGMNLSENAEELFSAPLEIDGHDLTGEFDDIRIEAVVDLDGDNYIQGTFFVGEVPLEHVQCLR